MNHLDKILEELCLEPVLKDMITNKINIPIVSDYKPAIEHWYPHPPCFIPLFLGEGASYKGIILHFFFDREKTFVEYFLENGYISEYAMNFKQLSTALILNMIVIKDELTPEIIKFAKQIEYGQCSEVNQYSLTYGNNTEHFQELIYYKGNLPLKYTKEISTYKGDFPSSIDSIYIEQIQNENACSFELSNNAKQYVNQLKNPPTWLDKNINKKELFLRYVKEDQLKQAWLTLNSSGWLLKDIAEGLKVLRTKTDSSLFHAVTDNWIEGWKYSKSQEYDCY